MTGDTHNVAGGEARIGTLTQAGVVHRLNIYQGGLADPVIPTPRQLPPPPARFYDREREQEEVLRVVRRWGAGDGGDGQDARADGHGPLGIRITGLWGVGRTALARRFAARLAEDDPEAVVLWLDLDDCRRDGGCDQVEAVGQLLTGLEVEEAWQGRSLHELRRAWWRHTDRRRMIVVLDNARQGSEVVPLLPASARSTVIVVSQARLHDLPNRPDVHIHLEPLPRGHAVRMLTDMLDDGDARLADDQDAATRLVELCGGLPAVLHVAAHWLRRHHRRTVSRLIEGLEAELTQKGVPGMEALWDDAYAALGEPARRLYRLLAVAPACELPEEAVLALLGADVDTGLTALEELENTGLLESCRARRVRMHDLVRAHALRRARTEAARHGANGLYELERAALDARRRLVRWYRRQAQRADLRIAATRLRVAPLASRRPGDVDVRFDDARVARAWLAGHRQALHACVRIAYEDGAREAGPAAGDCAGDPGGPYGTGEPGAVGADGAVDAPGGSGAQDRDAGRDVRDAGCGDDAWALCEPLFVDHLDHPHVADTLDVFRLGLAAAQRAENLEATVRMRCQVGRVLVDLGRAEEAEGELNAAVRAAELLSAGLGTVMPGPAGASVHDGPPPASAPAPASAAPESDGTLPARASEDDRTEPEQRRSREQGERLEQQGEREQREQREERQERANRRRKLHASAMEFRARALGAQGRWAEAVPDYETALRVHEAISNPYGAALMTYLLGEAAVGLGQEDRARALLTRAREAFRDLGRDRMTARAGFKLAGVERAAGRFDESAALYEASLAAARERGSTFDEVRVLDALTAVAAERGDTAAAETYRTRASAIRRREEGSADGGDGGGASGA